MKRFEGTKALAFTSLMAALNLISILLVTFTTGIGILVLLIVPLTSSLVAILCPTRYSLSYLVATSLMSFISPQFALFTVLPSLISGILSGILIKYYVQGYFIIFFNAIVITFLQVISTYLINVIFNVNIVTLFGQLLKLEEIMPTIYLMFLFVISLIQASLSYLIAYNELKKLNIEFNEKKNRFLLVLFTLFLSIVSTIGFSFIYKPVSYLLLSFSFYFGCVMGYYLFSYYQRKIIILIQCPMYFISLVLFASLMSLVIKEYRYLLLLILPTSEIFTSLYIVIYQYLYKKIGINESLFQ